MASMNAIWRKYLEKPLIVATEATLVAFLIAGIVGYGAALGSSWNFGALFASLLAISGLITLVAIYVLAWITDQVLPRYLHGFWDNALLALGMTLFFLGLVAGTPTANFPTNFVIMAITGMIGGALGLWLADAFGL